MIYKRHVFSSLNNKHENFKHKPRHKQWQHALGTYGVKGFVKFNSMVIGQFFQGLTLEGYCRDEVSNGWQIIFLFRTKDIHPWEEILCEKRGSYTVVWLHWVLLDFLKQMIDMVPKRLMSTLTNMSLKG